MSKARYRHSVLACVCFYEYFTLSIYFVQFFINALCWYFNLNSDLMDLLWYLF